MNTHPHQPKIYLCSSCESSSFEIEFFNASMFIRCTNCKVFHQHLLSKLSEGMFAPSTILVPQQEPAVQVPATAPAAGHLSATSETTLSAEAQHQLIPNCPSCGAQYADLVHDPVLKTDFIMCSDCNFEGKASQHLSTETVDK